MGVSVSHRVLTSDTIADMLSPQSSADTEKERYSFITWALSEKLDSVIVTVTGHTCSSLCYTIPNDLVPSLYARKRWPEPFGMFLHVEQHLLAG